MPLIPNFLTKPRMILYQSPNNPSLKNVFKSPKTLTFKDDTRTDSGEPPDNTDNSPTYGNYCFRVTTTLEKENDKIREYTGWDDNISIVEKVEKICANDEHLFCDTKCARSRLSFVHDVQHCDGHVDIRDFNHGATYQSF